MTAPATAPACEQDVRRQRTAMLRGAAADARREHALAVVLPELLDAVLDELDELRARRATPAVIRHPDPERALLVARGEADGNIEVAAAELAIEVARLRALFVDADARADRLYSLFVDATGYEPTTAELGGAG